jgi:hypothetical protein
MMRPSSIRNLALIKDYEAFSWQYFWSLEFCITQPPGRRRPNTGQVVISHGTPAARAAGPRGGTVPRCGLLAAVAPASGDSEMS